MYSNGEQGFGNPQTCSTVPPMWALKTISCHVRPKALSFTTAAQVDKTKNSFFSHLRIISALTPAVKDQRAFEACSYFRLPWRNIWGLWQPAVSCNGRLSDPLSAQNWRPQHWSVGIVKGYVRAVELQKVIRFYVQWCPFGTNAELS